MPVPRRQRAEKLRNTDKSKTIDWRRTRVGNKHGDRSRKAGLVYLRNDGRDGQGPADRVSYDGPNAGRNRRMEKEQSGPRGAGPRRARGSSGFSRAVVRLDARGSASEM